jgi:hypothetical protein
MTEDTENKNETTTPEEASPDLAHYKLKTRSCASKMKTTWTASSVSAPVSSITNAASI